MNKLDVIAIESFNFRKNNCDVIPNSLIKQLYEFLATSYHLAEQKEFEYLILQPEKEGELTVLFGLNGSIAGLSRTIKQHLVIGKKEVTVFTALMYFNTKYKPFPLVVSMGLNLGMSYKLSHPEEEIVYIAFTNSPYSYKLVNKISNCLYPKPSQAVPKQVLTIVNSIKKKNGWISSGANPMVVFSPLVPIRGQAIQLSQEEDELDDFYLEANPDYMQGSALLTYIPLHLANINYGMKLAQKPPIHPGLIFNLQEPKSDNRYSL